MNLIFGVVTEYEYNSSPFLLALGVVNDDWGIIYAHNIYAREVKLEMRPYTKKLDQRGYPERVTHRARHRFQWIGTSGRLNGVGEGILWVMGSRATHPLPRTVWEGYVQTIAYQKKKRDIVDQSLL